MKPAVRNLDGGRPLRQLIERVLGYDYSGGLISTEGWPDNVLDSLASEPELLATAGRDGRFAVIMVASTHPASSP